MGFFSWLFNAGSKPSAGRSTATSQRSRRKSRAAIHKVYRHGNCPVNHRTHEAAERCRNG